ncbi:hypothetical protein [Pseudomaricurvus sp.]|uniref:hypothetical protein n=1 Tax=Pseudomaricurvus sp. TaxID=2004510 RepID=UPI003F6B19D3
MSGLPNPEGNVRAAVLEPAVNTYSANNKYKQLARILLHLRNDLHLEQPHLAMPTSAMIEHLVFNCPLSLLEGDDWQEIIIQSLEYLIDQLSPYSFSDELFLRCDCNQPLFPNEELFDPQDAFLFARTLLRQQQQVFE